MQSGKQDSTLKLSSLTAGKYRFKVEVTDQNGYGEALVNVTVLEVLRVNQPPVAVISPNTVNQVLTLPNDATVLDGSGSHDDDGIISYHWKLLQGPLQKDDAKDENILQDGQILKLENLIVGSYTYKLTVTDTDGLTNSTLAHVLVNKGIDNKPIANAGVQQLITLPQDSAVLCGNQSRDDWGIVSYEWSLSPDSVNQVVDLQGARSDCLHVSKLVVGEYKFQLVVTDKAKQTDTATVSV
uniref:PKD domain-containing protein n=1 Tax=Ciona savignyi TaxID=51511 RepID=H2YLW6_CIOSA